MSAPKYIRFKGAVYRLALTPQNPLDAVNDLALDLEKEAREIDNACESADISGLKGIAESLRDTLETLRPKCSASVQGGAKESKAPTKSVKFNGKVYVLAALPSLQHYQPPSRTHTRRVSPPARKRPREEVVKSRDAVFAGLNMFVKDLTEIRDSQDVMLAKLTELTAGPSAFTKEAHDAVNAGFGHLTDSINSFKIAKQQLQKTYGLAE